VKSVKFWRTEIRDLSFTEKMFFRDAIKTLLAWRLLKDEYKELDLIERILELEITADSAPPEDRVIRRSAISKR